jgi:hypothetical protein
MLASARMRLWTRLGVGGAVATYVGLATLLALAIPLFIPADETAHVDYAYRLSHGELPIAGSHLHAEFPTLKQRSGTQYVAYHPPLYYALIAPLVRLGTESTHPRIWLLAARGVGIALTVITIVLVAVLARRVFAHWDSARRSQLAVLAAGLVAAVPSMIGATAAIQNDPLELVLVLAAGVCLAGIVRNGITARRAVVLGVVCGLGMLSRVTFVQVLLTCVATVVVVLVLHRDAAEHQTIRQRTFRAAAYLSPVVLGPVLIAGWFYVLNHSRYGTFTGSNIAYDLVSNRHLDARMKDPLHFAFNPFSWWSQLLQVGGEHPAFVATPGTAPRIIATLLAVCLTLGVVAIALRWKSIRPDRESWILLGGLLLVLLISFAEIALHVSHKGSENNRYLIDALPFWGIAFGVALLAIGPRRFPVAAFAVIIAEVFASLNIILTVTRRQHALLDAHHAIGALAASMGNVGVPHPRAVLGLILAVTAAGVIAQCTALVVLGAIHPEGRGEATDVAPAADSPASDLSVPAHIGIRASTRQGGQAGQEQVGHDQNDPRGEDNGQCLT